MEMKRVPSRESKAALDGMHLIAQGRLPQPVKIGGSTRFSERECRAFVAERIAERDNGGAS